MMRIFMLLPVVLVVSACHPGEGERCNPMLFTDECEEGFACTYPQNCGVAFCCPKSGTSTNANCQPCAPLDGGTGD